MQPAHRLREHAQKIYHLAALGKGAPISDLDCTILASWKRCMQNGDLDPLRHQDLNVLENARLIELRDRFESLMRLAEPALLELAKTLSGTDYAVLLTDHRGLVLQHVIEESIEREFRAAGLWPGADWGEDQAGTNGIGTCIVERQPVTVHKDEHFLSQNIGLTCSAAPIHDPHGNLLAVLDSSSCRSSDSRISQIHTRALVSVYARLIESQHFLREYRNQKILRFQERAELVALPDRALIALSEDNRVLAVNDVTLRLLEIADRSLIVGKELSDIIGDDLSGLFHHYNHGPETIHAFRNQNNGKLFYGLLLRHKQPVRQRGLTVPPTPTPGEDHRCKLCDLELLAGTDPQMLEAARRARKVVDKCIPLLIQGETGTGKDLFTQAMHRASQRRDKPFVALNCASIPEGLIESELFGYRQGAFTGANREGRRGKIIESSEGTLFLDEIGDMPLNMQSRLLRVLETQEVIPLGSEKSVRVELNIVSATHRDLSQLVLEGRFREDLYYRLNGITLSLPPLRARQDLSDIIMKVLKAENDTGRELRITPEAMTLLQRYPWPGNLRQLRNVLRAAIALCEEDLIDISDINLPATTQEPAGIQTAASDERPQAETGETEEANPLNCAERQVILASLNAHGGNISRTAEALDMSRNTLYRKMRKHKISHERS